MNLIRINQNERNVSIIYFKSVSSYVEMTKLFTRSHFHRSDGKRERISLTDACGENHEAILQFGYNLITISWCQNHSNYLIFVQLCK